MKRFAALFLAAVLMCGMLIVPVSAAKGSNYRSPEYVEPVTPPVEPPVDPVDPPVEPVGPQSPQTGYGMGIVGLTAAAALCGAVAAVAGKKAFGRN